MWVPETHTQQIRSWKTLRRVIALLAFAGLILAAERRWDGVPLKPLKSLGRGSLPAVPVDSSIDRTNLIITAVRNIPALPNLNLTAPPLNKKWSSPTISFSIELSDVCLGPWTPNDRPNLRASIEFVEAATTAAALDQLVAIPPGVCNLGGDLMPLRNAQKLLCFRARYRVAAHNRIDLASADLSAVMKLGHTLLSQSPSTIQGLNGQSAYGLALTEMCKLAHERPLSRLEAMAWLESIETYVFEKNKLGQIWIDSEFNSLRRVLDATHSQDVGGNGWIVLSRLDDVRSPVQSRSPRPGLWNLGSWLFNDRETISRKIDITRAEYTALINLPYGDAARRLVALRGGSRFGVTDGPVGWQAGSGLSSNHMLRMTTNTETLRVGTIISVALSKYRFDHGSYPRRLDDLAGDLLSQVPRDPFDDKPFRYKRQKNGADFLLYSVREDQVDGGGIGLLPDDSPPEEYKSTDDRAILHTRGRPCCEPQLVDQ